VPIFREPWTFSLTASRERIRAVRQPGDRYAPWMTAPELLGTNESAILAGVHSGAFRAGVYASRVRALSADPAAEFHLHEALRRCERAGLLRSSRDAHGRHYALTPAGRAQLRSHRGFKRALVSLLARSG
jgi:hypothetical protein